MVGCTSHHSNTPSLGHSTPAPPRAAYIHVPFCARKCGYCNFSVVAGRDDLIEAYLQAIERELSFLGKPREVDTLYLGGGTPTQLSPKQLARLLKTAKQWHPLADRYELTVEANPNDLDAERAGVLACHGVNRVSLGVQSFADAKLQRLERDHRVADIESAAAAVRSIDANLAIDLIYGAPSRRSDSKSASPIFGSQIGRGGGGVRGGGLRSLGYTRSSQAGRPNSPNGQTIVPGESTDEWQHDLRKAIAIGPDHISVYGLTIERGSAFFGRRARGVLSEIDEETDRTMYTAAIDRLTAARFEHYEISSFARPGKRSRHNRVYWQGEPYFAAGPGAARYVGGSRETNHRSTTTYIRRVLTGKSPVAERETLSPADRARELLVFSLRQLDGITRDEFTRRTGFGLDDLTGPAIAKFVQMGLLADDGHEIRLTRDGLLVSDSLWPELL